jgi:urea transport system ATP-binding protein
MRAIIGPNGAGKTTMMDIITGKTRPDTGEVYFDGTDLTKLDEAASPTLGIGRKFQKPTVFESHTVEDNLVLALKPAARRVQAALFLHPSAEEQQRIDEILEIVRLARRSGRCWRPPQRTARSSGWRSACCWRRTQAAAGRRAGRRHDRRRDGETAAAQGDRKTHSVVVVEHDMSFVRELGVKVTCLHEGSVLAEGTLDQVSPTRASSKCISGDDAGRRRLAF